MHETATVKEFVDVALRVAEATGADRITVINVLIGGASHLTSDAIRSTFEVLSAGTSAEGGALRISREPTIVTCPDCGYPVRRVRNQSRM